MQFLCDGQGLHGALDFRALVVYSFLKGLLIFLKLQFGCHFSVFDFLVVSAIGNDGL